MEETAQWTTVCCSPGFSTCLHLVYLLCVRFFPQSFESKSPVLWHFTPRYFYLALRTRTFSCTATVTSVHPRVTDTRTVPNVRSIVRFFFFLKREGKGRRKRGKETSMSGCLFTPCTGDLVHNPRVCPDWESNPWPFGLQACAHSTELQGLGHSQSFASDPFTVPVVIVHWLPCELARTPLTSSHPLWPPRSQQELPLYPVLERMEGGRDSPGGWVKVSALTTIQTLVSWFCSWREHQKASEHRGVPPPWLCASGCGVGPENSPSQQLPGARAAGSGTPPTLCEPPA